MKVYGVPWHGVHVTASTNINPYLPPAPPPGYGAPGYGPPGYGPQGHGPQWAGCNAPPRLFTTTAIALATFLGTALSGAALFAWNQYKLGHPKDAWFAVGVGVTVTAAVFALAMVLPDSATAAMTGVNLALVFGARALAAPRFDGPIAQAKAHGVLPHSTWWTVPVSLLVVIPAALVFLVAFSATQTTITVAPGQEIIIEGGVTEAEGRAAGESFVRQEFMGPKAEGGRGVILRTEGTGYVLGFFVTEGSWIVPTTIDAFGCIAGKVRSDVLRDQTTKVELLDDWGLAKKTYAAPSRSDPDFAARCGP